MYTIDHLHLELDDFECKKITNYSEFVGLGFASRRPPPCLGTGVPQWVQEGPFLAAGTIGLTRSGSRWSRVSLEWGRAPLWLCSLVGVIGLGRAPGGYHS